MSNAKAVKSVSWTPAMVSILTSSYTGDNTQLGKIATEIGGKTIAMVRGKLVSEGLYKPNVKTAVGGKVATRKISLVRSAEIFLSLHEGALDSFEKASKPDLDRLIEALSALSATHDPEVVG